ncbi:MAG: ATP-binding protein [Pseudomonadota bacterium]
MTQQQINRQFSAFIDGDSTAIDLIARITVVAGCGIALWLATDMWVMLVWGLGYAVMNLMFAVFLITRQPDVSFAELILATVSSAVIAFWYGGMVVYIGMLDDGAFLLLSVFGYIGTAQHCLARAQDFNYSAYIDLSASVLPGLGVVLVAAHFASSFWVSIATLVGGLFVLAYHVLAFQKVIHQSRRLEERVYAETQDQKMRALGQLTSGIAHDFNNLLAVVSVNVEMASATKEGEKRLEFLDNAKLATQSGAALIKQLMVYVHQSELEVTDVSVKSLLDRMSAVLHRILPSHITLHIAAISGHMTTRVDAALLETALLNLVINARDAIADQVGVIDINVECHETEDVITIHVIDNGPGMEAETLERASEPFFTTKAMGQGSGLGLSMVKGFAEQSGGSVTMSNRDQGGLHVSLRLPRASATC